MKEKTNVKKKQTKKTKNNLNTKTIANKGENVNIYFYQHRGTVSGKIAI